MAVILITGGTRGIGRAVLDMLIDSHNKIAFFYHSNDEIAINIEKQGKNHNCEIKSYKVDVRVYDEVNRAIKDIIKKWERIDVLVNNAGINIDRPLVLMNQNEWNQVMDTNTNGVFNVTRNCIYYMMKQKCGRVINVSSISGISGVEGQTNYSSSKAAIIGFTKALAKEVAEYGVAVNCVAPGGVETEMIYTMPIEKRERLIDSIPLKRLGRTEEVAQVILFLMDYENCPQYLTGATITIDGGLGI